MPNWPVGAVVNACGSQELVVASPPTPSNSARLCATVAFLSPLKFAIMTKHSSKSAKSCPTDGRATILIC